MRVARLTVAVVVALLASGCSRLPKKSARPELLIGVRADITGIYPNPPVQNEAFTIDVTSNFLTGLLRFGRNLRPEPALAQSWQSLDDRTWRFQLKPDLLFSNGEPVRAGDVAASLEATIKRPFVTGAFLEAIESVRALDETTVEIRTREPFPILPADLTGGYVLPAWMLAQPWIPAVSAAPFQYESWSPGRELVLVANERYSGAPPGFRRVRLLVMLDGEARVNALLSHRVQLIDNVPLADIDRLSKAAGIRVVSKPNLRVLFLALRMNAPPFSDVRVRRAVDLAIDRGELVRRALSGHAVVASQLVPPSVAGYNPALSVTRPDLGLARTLLRGRASSSRT